MPKKVTPTLCLSLCTTLLFIRWTAVSIDAENGVCRGSSSNESKQVKLSGAYVNDYQIAAAAAAAAASNHPRQSR